MPRKGGSIGRIDRLNEKYIQHSSSDKVGMCEECGKPFERVWVTKYDMYSNQKTCGSCRMAKANGFRKVTIPYSPHEAQQKIHDSEKRFKILVCGNRFGKDLGSIGEGVIKFLQMENEERSIDVNPHVLWWIIAPNMRLARQNWRDLKKLLPKELVFNISISNLTIETINGGIIEVHSADDPETLVGVGLDIVTITEAARIRDLDTVWANIRQRLDSPGRGPNGSGGVAIINSCVTADTLVLTENGLVEIGNISDARQQRTYDKCGLKVAGFYGEPQIATDFYCNGISETIKIITTSGYEIEGTHNHPVWVMGADGNAKWKRLNELSCGDYVAIRRGMNYWGNDCDVAGFSYKGKRLRPSDHGEDVDLSKMAPDLAYLMGLILGDGYVDFNQGKVSIAHSEEEIETIEFLLSQPHRLQFYRDAYQHTLACSKRFTSFLEWYGFKPNKTSKHKTLPNRLLSSPEWVIANFLSGLFDADGHARERKGMVGYTSSSKKLIKQIQFVLLNFGIMSRVTYSRVKPTKKVKVESDVWQISLSPKDSAIFYKKIGFKLTRKQNRKELIGSIGNKNDIYNGIPFQSERIKRIKIGSWYNKKATPGLYNLDKQKLVGYSKMRVFLDANHNSKAVDDMLYLENLIEENYYWDAIKSIDYGKAETFDFVIPKTHAFVSNGFISHNTPKGRTYFYRLCQMGKKESSLYSPEYETFHFSTWDNPHMAVKRYTVIGQDAMGNDVTFEDSIRRSMTNDRYKQDYLAEFIMEINSVFPKYEQVLVRPPLDCRTDEKIAEFWEEWEKVEPFETYTIGYDPASKGDGKPAVIRNSKGKVVKIDLMTRLGWDAQWDKLAVYSRLYNGATVNFGQTGLGETISSQLIKRGVPNVPLNEQGGNKPKLVEDFAVVVDQLWCQIPWSAETEKQLQDYVSIDREGQSTQYRNATDSGHDDIVSGLYFCFSNFQSPCMIIPWVGAMSGVKKKI